MNKRNLESECKMVSVIIPVYNAEKTLQKCVDSILEAGKRHRIEIILVNDGSSDSSEKICSEYVAHYNNILYICQNNQGVSAARNKGLKAATGEWIHFVDSDDWVKPNIYDCFDEISNTELIMFKYDSHGESTEDIKCKGEVLENTQILSIVLGNIEYGGYCWNKIFRKNIIEKYNIYFDEKIKLCEDQLFQIQYLQHIHLGYVLPNRPYHYSIINGGTYYNLEKVDSAIKAYESIMQMDFVKKEKEPLRKARVNYVSNCVRATVRAVKCGQLRRAKEYKKFIKPYIGVYLKSDRPSFIYKIVAFFIFICPVI